MKRSHAIALFALVVATSAFAQEQWSCDAQGKQGFGGPVGDVWVTTSGSGETEFDARNSAVQHCFGQGLQSCMVTFCWQEN